jgi:hypothetical protein
MASKEKVIFGEKRVMLKNCSRENSVILCLGLGFQIWGVTERGKEGSNIQMLRRKLADI